MYAKNVVEEFIFNNCKIHRKNDVCGVIFLATNIFYLDIKNALVVFLYQFLIKYDINTKQIKKG